MAGAFPWATPNTADTLCTAASMNALADAAGVVGSEINNATGLYTRMMIHVRPDTDITSVGLDARLDCFIIYAPDGTNYPGDASPAAAEVSGSYYVGSISAVDAVGAAAAQVFRDGILDVAILPFKMKLVIVNELGAAFPANNNAVVEGYRYNGAYT